jgi:F-type H+-transporting ATPase subunit gamma
VRALREDGKTTKILCVGRKGRDMLRREFGELMVDTIEDVARPRLSFDKAVAVAERVVSMFEDGEFDVCTIVYAKFKSAIAQEVAKQQLIPFAAPEPKEGHEQPAAGGASAVYEYEPDEAGILAELLPRNLAVQIYKALLENNASEQGARMTAMDNATRNAGEMIGRLTLLYNRTRQAAITRELIEIISAKEAM